MAVVTGLDLAGHVGDGVNTYGYRRGRMRGAGDPSGLIMHNLLELAAQSVVIGERGVRGGVESMTGQYSLNMEVDLEWAMDWSQSDDMHSRHRNVWVHDSFRSGMAQGFADGIMIYCLT